MTRVGLSLQYQLGITQKGYLWIAFCLTLFVLGTAFRVPLVWILATLLFLPIFTYPYYLNLFLKTRSVQIEWQVASTAVRAETILIVVATVENNSSEPLNLHLALDLSSTGLFIEKSSEQLIHLEPRWMNECIWYLTFLERGKATVGPLYAGITGMGGFFSFWRKTIPAPVELTVMAQLPPVKLDEKVQRRIYGQLVGAFAQQVRGIGTDFHALRDYVPGDERKHISWKATARFGRLISKEYELDQNLQTFILLDCGRTMEGKLDYALTSAIEFGELLEFGHHELGLIFFSSKIDAFLRPGSGRQHQLRRLQHTAQVQAHSEPGSLLHAVRFFIGQRFRRSLVLIISDLEGDHREKQIALSELRIQHHVVIFVNLHTPSFARTAQHLRDAATAMDPIRRQFAESVIFPDVAYRYFVLERNFQRMLEKIGAYYFKVASPRSSALLEFEKWMRSSAFIASRETPFQTTMLRET